MDPQEIRRAIDDAIARWNAQDERYFEAYAPDVVVHGLPPEAPGTLEGLRGMFRMMWAAFPDMRADVRQIVVEGDRCGLQLAVTGTHRGEFLGIPATGRTVNVGAMVFLRFDAAGKVAERWQQLDDLALLRQLGAMPAASST